MFRSKFVSANNMRTHVLDSYLGEVPILMAHGFTDNSECIIPLAKRLPSNLSPKIYDARGHGLSEAPRRGYSEHNMAMDAVELARSLDLQKPILFGHSMGANTMAIVANEMADVQAVILEDPPSSMDERNQYDIRTKRKRLEEWRKQSHMEIRVEYSNYPEFMADRIATARKQIRPEVLKIAERGYSSIQDILDSGTDTLILRPDPSETDRTTKTQDFPSNVELQIVQGASHTIFRDKPSKFTKIVSKFIKDKLNN